MREDPPVAVPPVTAGPTQPAQPVQPNGPGDGQLHIVAEPRWDVYYAVVFATDAVGTSPPSNIWGPVTPNPPPPVANGAMASAA